MSGVVKFKGTVDPATGRVTITPEGSAFAELCLRSASGMRLLSRPVELPGFEPDVPQRVGDASVHRIKPYVLMALAVEAQVGQKRIEFDYFPCGLKKDHYVVIEAQGPVGDFLIRAADRMHAGDLTTRTALALRDAAAAVIKPWRMVSR